MAARRAVLLSLGVLGLAGIAGGGACGKKSSQQAPARDDAAVVRDAAEVTAPIEDLPLGLTEVSAFEVERRPEQRDDPAAMVAAAREALREAPAYPETSWLLAIALGRLGKYDELLAPLARAVAADFGAWGEASLAHPALAGFLATEQGDAWRRHVDEVRGVFTAAVERATIMTGRGELFAFAAAANRWLRLTRTGGRVVAGLVDPAGRELAFLTVEPARGTNRGALQVGVVALADGAQRGPVPLGTARPITLAYSTKPPRGWWIGAGAKTQTWRHLDGTRLVAVPKKPKPARPAGPRLEVDATGVRLHAVPVAGVIADWDEHGLASALRIDASNRVVSAPSPSLIVGNTVRWSPDRASLAFVAQLDETCVADAPGSDADAAAFVVDVATGKLTEVVRGAGGLALAWVSNHALALAGREGVVIHRLDGEPSLRFSDVTGLLGPRSRSCVTAAAPAERTAPAVQPSDATVVGPP